MLRKKEITTPEGKALKALLENAIDLHTKRILEQYGLTEEQSLEIVSNLTKVPKDKIAALRNHRDNEISKNAKEFCDDLPRVVQIFCK